MILKLLKDRITNFWILLLNYSWYVNRNALNSNCPFFENGIKAPLMITNIKTFVINFALRNFVWHSKNTQRYISRNWKKSRIFRRFSCLLNYKNPFEWLFLRNVTSLEIFLECFPFIYYRTKHFFEILGIFWWYFKVSHFKNVYGGEPKVIFQSREIALLPIFE